MTAQRGSCLRGIDWSRAISLILGATLLLPLFWIAQAPNPGVQPILLEVAAGRPEATVHTIVQKWSQDGRVEELVTRLGGKVTKDLRIINAFAAELPANAVPRLARDPGVRWISLDAAVTSSARRTPTGDPLPQNYYLDTLGVSRLRRLQGDGVTVAVIDSGIANDLDFAVKPGAINQSRILHQLAFSHNSSTVNDVSGHGTHIAGIIGGNGSDSEGIYRGIAPRVNLISLKISDDTGLAYESDTVAAMQWVLENKAIHNIRVVNLSVNSSTEQSYHTSPMDAAAEILWFNGIVVIASAGNKGPAGGNNTVNSAPANDPFIITIGASDENRTPGIADDTLAPYSAHGRTRDGFMKPEIIAPGTSIISVLSKSSSWGSQYPDRAVLDGEYFRLSGTSMAAPMVAGAVALLLQDQPHLTPDQVKYRLLQTGNALPNVTTPYLNVYAAVTGTTTASANAGVAASQLLWTGNQPVQGDNVNWGSVNWSSVNWGRVKWGSTWWGN